MASYNGGGRDPRGDYASKEADRIKDMTAALKQWDRESINRCRGNQVEAKKKLVEAIGFDRRFDSFDSQRLADRVEQCKNGAVFDWSDPFLRKGAQARPQALKGFSGGR